MSEKPQRLNQNELLQLFRYVIAEFQFFAKISIVNIFWLKTFCPTDICSTDKQFTNNHNETYCQENYNINSRHAKGSLNIFPSLQSHISVSVVNHCRTANAYTL
jgi:hypothetical protein